MYTDVFGMYTDVFGPPADMADGLLARLDRRATDHQEESSAARAA